MIKRLRIRGRSLRLGIAAGLVLGALGLARASQTPPALAAYGDFVHVTYFSARCSPAINSLGVGIAFDGQYLWYSCYATGSAPDLYKVDALNGDVIASFNVAGGLGALAWDSHRQKLWAGWGGGAGAEGSIRLIDPANGSATVVFIASQALGGGELDNGLAYDARADSLYISEDAATTIHHYSATGAYLGNFTWTGRECYNSGLAIAGDILFQGSNGCNHVWAARLSDLAPVFDFATDVTGDAHPRDEDLECDDVTFAPKTVIWSMEAYEPRRAVAFEIPAGHCVGVGEVDSDGDGLLNEWEIHGLTFDPDGAGPLTAQFVNLPAMGADANRPDIFMQIDWMADGTHNHALDLAAIRKVVEAFDRSPYATLTGSVGINLHVDQGSGSLLNFKTGAIWGSLSKARQLLHTSNLGSSSGGLYNWTAFQGFKGASGGFTASGRAPVFHYAVAAHNYGGTAASGISRGVGASDLVISLGSFSGGVGSVKEQAGTLMHMLGHNLGLRHGGDEGVNFKPNYLSVMNFAFQMGGVIWGNQAGVFDFSRLELPTLVESSLNEPDGLGESAAGYGTRHFCLGKGFVPRGIASAPIDWNCDGDRLDVNVAYDINGSGSSSDTLSGYEDWSHLQLKAGAIGQVGVAPSLPIETPLDLLTPAVEAQILPLYNIFLPKMTRQAP